MQNIDIGLAALSSVPSVQLQTGQNLLQAKRPLTETSVIRHSTDSVRALMETLPSIYWRWRLFFWNTAALKLSCVMLVMVCGTVASLARIQSATQQFKVVVLWLRFHNTATLKCRGSCCVTLQPHHIWKLFCCDSATTMQQRVSCWWLSSSVWCLSSPAEVSFQRHPEAARATNTQQTWRQEFLGSRSSTVEWPSTRASAAETLLRFFQTIFENASFWQLKRLVTLSTYGCYINNCIYLSL